jgi:tripartite ATP-independent transporter DctM subunit
MSSVTVGVIGLFAVLGLFLSGIEIAYAMAIVGFLGFCYLANPIAAMNLIAKDFFDVFSSYGLTVVPLFVLMGQIAFNAGIAKRLYDSTYKFVGHVPGGLAMATVAGATAFKAICGSTIATAATFAVVAIPEMDRYSYSKKLSTGVVAVVGTLGSLIPPSVFIILLGIITEQSIGKLVLAGIFPGLLIAFFFIVVIYGWCKMNPALGPKGESFPWKERIKSLPELIWVVLIFVIVVFGLVWGFFTPTEAGSMGTLAVLLLSLAKKDITWANFLKSIAESLNTACMVLTLIAGSTVFGHFLAVSKIPIMAADFAIGLPYPRALIMVVIAFIYLLGGSFMEDLAFVIIATPIFYPIAVKLGYDPMWFCIFIGIVQMIGIVIPPVAINVFVVKNISKVPLATIYQGVTPFLISIVVGAIFLFLFPQIALWLPSVLMK